MTGKHEPMLHGWDDEKVYYWDETGHDWCVSDHPDLLARLMDICRNYFAQQAVARSEGQTAENDRGRSEEH